MSVSDAPSWQAPVALIVLVALIAASAAGAYREARARGCAVVVVALAAFVVFKEGVVRLEPNHVAIYFASAAMLWLAIPWGASRRIALSGALVLGAVSLHAVLPSGFGLDPIGNISSAGGAAKTLVSSGRRQDLTDSGRLAMRSIYRLDPASLAELRGHSVEIDPWEIGVAWAYGLDWDPLPAFQSYVAYTGPLDDLNSDELVGGAAPERILRENSNLIDPNFPDDAIDARYAGWDPPRENREILCHYAPMRTTQRWQVLGRVPDRCGEPRPAGSVDAAWGEAVDVPAPHPGEMIFARIHGAAVSGLEKLRSFLYRSSLRYATIDGGAATYRLIPGTAADGLMLRASPSLVEPAPFARIPQAETIALSGRDGELTYEFFRVSVRMAPKGSG